MLQTTAFCLCSFYKYFTISYQDLARSIPLKAQAQTLYHKTFCESKTKISSAENAPTGAHTILPTCQGTSGQPNTQA